MRPMTMNTELPDIHPGMPGHYQIAVNVWLVDVTDKALRVSTSVDGGPSAWLPRSQVNARFMAELFNPAKPELIRVRMPAWLYRKFKSQMHG